MTPVWWAAIGLLLGWGGGRLLALQPAGTRGDLLAGALGAIVAGSLARLVDPGAEDSHIGALVASGAGALVLTLIRRAWADRYRRPAV